MLIEIIFSLCLGILFGIFTGLTPGIHINLIGSSLVYSSPFLYFINPIYFVVFIVSLAITHTFLDFIPSVLLGCPDTDTELSILPGHELLKQGFGYEAIMLTAYGGLAAIFILMLMAYPSIILLSKTYNIIQNFIPYLLIIISLFMIFSEKRKFNALVAFSLTGFLGLCVLNLEILKQPLLPLLTGLFGSSILIQSIKEKPKIAEQKITQPNEKILKPILASTIASPLCSFLPGLGTGQAAIIGNTILKTNNKGFLILLGATNTIVMGFSFISLYVISKTRTGAAVTIKELIGTPTTQVLILILIIIFLSGIISFFITKKLAKFFSEKITEFDYTKISIITLIILTIIIIAVSGFLGFLIFIISTFTGIYCISLGVRRTNMMGCLLIPVIVWYLF